MEKKKVLEVEAIFANDGMFLANDGRLYRYQVKNGVIKAYKKARKTNVDKEKIYKTIGDRERSDFWLIQKSQKKVFFKRKDDSLDEIISRWGTRAECHTPFVYGDLLFIITDLEWKCTEPYAESMEATYHVIRAKLDKSGYLDVTGDICSPNDKIIEVSHLNPTSCELR